MSTNANVYGIVIVFNPSAVVLDNIKSYIKPLNKLFIYDNSTANNEALFQSLYKEFDVEYMHSGRNDGISKSLNVVAEKLYNIKNSWLLTMDQDSRFDELALHKMIGFASCADDNVGILSPFHKTALTVRKSNIDVEERLTVMTSGNLLNVAIHKKIGGFDEKYFIDCVDWEYCLKLNSFNYKVLMLNNIDLEHGLGEPIHCKSPISKKEVVVLNHNYIRRYYITRNKLLISSQYINKYPKLCIRYSYGLLSSDFKNIVPYEDDKLHKIMFFLKGIKDFVFRRFGALDDLNAKK